MKANELRIDNFVLIDDITRVDVLESCHIDSPEKLINSSHFVIKSIADDFCNLLIGEEEIEFEISEIEPILLTKEWLVKFGFEKENGIYSIVLTEETKLRASLQKGYTAFVIDEECFLTKDSVSLKDIKYVNQLQNLYFSLTGEELTI